MWARLHFEEILPVEQDRSVQSQSTVFKRRRNCWRITHAEHASLLVDCANYYSALHAAISKAEHSIFILGWEIDSQMRLLRGEEEKKNKLPSVVLDLLRWKAQQNPDLNI